MPSYKGIACLVICAVVAASTVRAEEDAALQRYFTGNALYNRKMYPLAIEEYKQFLAENPEHPKADRARTGMAMCYYSLGKYAEAEPLLTALVAKETVDDAQQLQLLLAQSLLKLKKLAEAEKVFAALVAIQADAGPAAAILAGLLETQYGQKKWMQVIPSAKALLATEPDAATRTRALYQAAYACHQLKKFTEAIPYLTALQPMVKGGALAPQVAFFLAESYRMTSNLDGAAAQYGAAAKGFKGDVAAEIYYRLGFVQFRRKDYAGSASAMTGSLAQSSNGIFSGEATLYLGRCHFEQKDMTRAAELLETLCNGTQVVAAGGKVPLAEATLWRARIYSRSGKHGQAAAFIGGILPKLGTDPLLPDLLFDQANAQIAQAKYKDAVTALQAVLRHKNWPQVHDALRLYAICLHHKGDFAASLEQANAFIAAYKKDKLMPEVLFVRAENLYFLKKLGEAEQAYAAFLSSYPGHASTDATAFRLAQIHHRNEKWEGALKDANALLLKTPKGKLFSQLRFIAGDASFRLKNWKKAVAHLTLFITQYPPVLPSGKKQTEPNTDSALIELAIAQINQENAAEAIANLQTLVTHCDKSPHLPLGLSELGRLYYEAKQYAPARKSLEQFVSVAPNDSQRPKVESYLGWISLSEEQDEAAEKHFSVVVNTYGKDPLAPEAFLQLGLVQLAQKKYADAQGTFTKLLAAYPKHARKDLATFSLGVSLARLKQWSGAIPHLRAVITMYPDCDYASRALYELAWCEKGQKNKKAAADWYRKLIASYPEDKLINKVRTELAELTFEAKNYDEVIEQLQKTLGTLSDPALKEQTTYRLGTAYFNKADNTRSAMTFDAFIKEFPTSRLLGSAHFQAGESYMKDKEMIKARDHFLAASLAKKLTPELKESILIRLGETQGLTKQWAESSASYTTFLTAYPDSKWIRNARFGLAWALEKQQKFEEAIAKYNTVIVPQKDELSARSQFQIGECLFSSKKYDEAIKALIPVQISYRYEDWAAKALLETGRIMEAKGDRNAAMDQFKEVIKKFPKHNAAVVAKQRLDAIRVGGI